MSFLFGKVEDVTTISKSQSLSSVSIKTAPWEFQKNYYIIFLWAIIKAIFTYSPWRTLGVPSAITSLGQLSQSPPLPIPGEEEVPVTSLTYWNIEARMDRPKSVVRVMRGVAWCTASGGALAPVPPRTTHNQPEFSSSLNIDRLVYLRSLDMWSLRVLEGTWLIPDEFFSEPCKPCKGTSDMLMVAQLWSTSITNAMVTSISFMVAQSTRIVILIHFPPIPSPTLSRAGDGIRFEPQQLRWVRDWYLCVWCEGIGWGMIGF